MTLSPTRLLAPLLLAGLLVASTPPGGGGGGGGDEEGKKANPPTATEDVSTVRWDWDLEVDADGTDGYLTLELVLDDEGGETTLVDLALLPSAERLRRARRLRPVERYAHLVAEPRAGLEPEAVARALEVARESAAAFSPDWKLSGEEDWRRANLHRKAWENAARVLIVHGDATDATRLLARPEGEDDLWLRDRFAAAGLLELRLGRLEEGELAAALGGETVHARQAAMTLDHFGSSLGHDLLRELLQDPVSPRAADLAARCLVDEGDPATRAAMHALGAWLEREIPTQAWRTWGYGWAPLAAWAVVHDDAELQRLALGRPLGARQARELAWFVEDPVPLFEYRAERGHIVDAGYAGIALRGADPATLARAGRRLRDAVWRHELAHAPEGKEPEVFARGRLLRFDFLRSYLWPSRTLADYAYEGRVDLWDVPWVPAFGDLEELPAELLAGELAQGGAEQLDHVPHDELVAAFAELDAAARMPGIVDAVLAHHLVCTRAFRIPFDAFPDGTFHRPYALKHVEGHGYGGALQGILRVTPRLEGARLVFEVGVEQAASYACESFIDFKEGRREEWEHHRYVADGGRALIDTLRLRRGDESIEVRPLADGPDGAARFEATLDRPDLAEVVAEVQLDFFEQDPVITCNLWLGDLALELADGVRGGAPEPDVDELRGRGFEAWLAGDPDAAADAFGAAYERTPRDVDTGRWLAASLWLAGREDEALEVARALPDGLRAAALRHALEVLSGADAGEARADLARHAAAGGGLDALLAGLAVGRAPAGDVLEHCRSDVERAKARFHLAVGALVAGDEEGARWQLERCVAVGPEALLQVRLARRALARTR